MSVSLSAIWAISAMTAAFPMINAVPLTNAPALSSPGIDGKGATIWISKVAPTIFGQDAKEYDYHIFSDAEKSVEAVERYRQAVATSRELEILPAFLNVTMSGTLSSAQASDLTWMCQELGPALAGATSSCPAVAEASRVQKRSRYYWVQSGNHVPSNAAVQALHDVLNLTPMTEFPESPRSFCNDVSNGGVACISWSAVEQFSYGSARDFISDAQSVVNFDRSSAQANGVLGSGADVCISDRARGCT
jgi:hypothetical protein